MSTASNPLDLAQSVPVPNVQELAATLSVVKSVGGDVPQRYIRPEAEADPVASPAAGDELPVIDLSKLVNPELLDQDEFAKLGFACREWGFFQDILLLQRRITNRYYTGFSLYSELSIASGQPIIAPAEVINHGVPDEVINKTKDDVMGFFKLPLKEREIIKQAPGNMEGYGQLFVQSEEQKLDWADMLILVTHPLARKDMRFWPTNPTSFRDTLDRYASEIRKLTGRLIRMMAKDLRVRNPEFMSKLFSEELQSVRINYYPPCKYANKVLGLSPHSDGTGLTVLLQANDVNGLQIKKDDMWFPVTAKPGAFIVNIGDVIEIMSNGKYRSIEHRVIISPEKERLSIATFQLSQLDFVVRPLPELIEGDGERYRATSVEEFMKAYMSEKLDGKSILERLKLQR